MTWAYKKEDALKMCFIILSRFVRNQNPFKMKELLLFLILLRTPLIISTLETTATQIKLIQDLVNSDNSTILINVIGCWDQGIFYPF